MDIFSKNIGVIASRFDKDHASLRRACGLLALAACCAILFKWLCVVAGIAHISAEPAWRTLRFFLFAGIITTGPGLFMLSRMKLGGGNPFLAPTFVISTSLGSTMLVAWALYATDLFTTSAAIAVVAISTALGLTGLARMARDLRGGRSAARAHMADSFLRRLEMSLSEAFCLVAAALLAQGMFEAFCGHPFRAWDAIVSYDKWAADIAGRRWAGGYITGGYPQGIPLLVALLYKLCLPSGADPVLSLEALLAPGLFQVFPILVSLAVLSISRNFRVNPLFPLGMLFGHAWFATGVEKFVGYVDVPLGAFAASAIALAAAIGGERKKGMTAGGLELAALVAVFFAVAFTKGNGFVALALSLAATALPRCNWRFRGLCPAMVAALLAAGTYYLWQWTIGVWCPSLAETSLFNHSLPVVSSHRELMTPDFAHFIGQMRITWESYGMRIHLPMAAAVVLGVAVPTAAMLVRQTRRAAILVTLLVAIWFFTGSYDMRNLLYLMPAIAIIVALSVKFGLPCRVADAVALASSILLLYSISQTGLPKIANRPFRHYSPPKEVIRTTNARMARGIGLSEKQIRVLQSSDIIRRAPCIVALTKQDNFLMKHYRYLLGKGVYTLDGRSHGKWPKSLAISIKYSRWREEGFTLVSEFVGGKWEKSQLLMASPEFVDVPFEIVPLRDGFSEVDVNCAGLEFGNSGIVRLQLASGSAPFKFKVLGQNPVWARIMRSTHFEDAVSTVFLLDGQTDSLRLKVPEGARIAGVSIGW